MKQKKQPLKIKIRNFKNGDEEQIARICLATGLSGKDASEYFNNKKLLAYYYALPYVKREPELCFVAAVENLPLGYILGTKDSKAFSNWCEASWFPELRKKFPKNSAVKTPFEKRILELIHKGYKPKEELLNFPAHLHIDILPIAQGQGMGRKLIIKFLEKLIALNVPAVHLEVGKKNLNAIGFYKNLGFEIIKEYEASIAFGKYLN